MKNKLVLTLFLPFLAACGKGEGGGGEVTPKPQSFPITQCDSDQDCGQDFECSPVYCTMQCIPDGLGGCLPCNNGKKGQCMPKAPGEPPICKEGEPTKVCEGSCDPATGQCKDVACAYSCVLPPKSCENDEDCGEGHHCEFMCYKGCTDPSAYSGSAQDFEAKCPGADCTGICVPNPPKPKSCDSDADCAEGEKCVPVYCPMICIPDGMGGCLPCNDGKMGQCVPAPVGECVSDRDCDAGEVCEVICAAYSDPFAGIPYPTEECFGICVPQSLCDRVICPPKFHCEEVCYACAQKAWAEGGRNGIDTADNGITDDSCDYDGCYAVCVPDLPEPRPCNTDADCDPGFVCEPIYCANPAGNAKDSASCVPGDDGRCTEPPDFCGGEFIGICVPAPIEGCKDDSECPQGMVCKIYCTGLCDPYRGCGNPCFGQCEPATPPEECDADRPCPPGFECATLCVDCVPYDLECKPACINQCVPVPPKEKCNSDADCPEGFHCEPVFCTMQCIPDGNGGCVPCNDGYLGECVPNADEGCRSDSDCKPGEHCETFCMGLCHPNAGCGSTCIGVCIPSGCKSDEDCPEGTYCVLTCPPDCVQAYAQSSDNSTPPTCIETHCIGQCLPKPETCESDSDCKEGFVCVLVEVCPPCYYSDPPCLAPCKLEGHCEPKPTGQCQKDEDCGPNECCHFACTYKCDPAQYCGGPCEGYCGPCKQPLPM